MVLRAAGGFLVAAVAGAILAGALASAATRAALAEAGPACLFRALTGLVCPFCGMTHAAIHLGAGEWRAALADHPLAPLVAIAVAWCGWCLLRGRPLSVLDRRIDGRAVLAAVALVWAANIIAHAS